MPHRVFIAYSHNDKDRVLRVEEDLRNAGFDPRRDDNELAVGRPISGLKKNIEESDALLLILTRHSAQSNFVQSEYEHALKKGVPVIAVVLGDLGDWPWWYGQLHDTKHLDGNYLVQGLRDRIIEAVREQVRRARVVAFFNMKGGVGKTTLAAQFAARMANGTEQRRPVSVLMIDLDPQQSLTELFVSPTTLAEAARQNRTVVGLCEPLRIGTPRQGDALQAVEHTPPSSPPDYRTVPITLGSGQASVANSARFDIVAGDFEAIRYTDELGVNRQLLVHHFEHALNALRGTYDLIVLDCNPSVSPLTHCALKADHVVLPVTPDDLGRRGFVFYDRFVSRHVTDDERPRQSAVFNKVYTSKKPKGQDGLMRALRAGNEELAPGASRLAPHLVQATIPVEKELVTKELFRSEGGDVSAFAYSEGTEKLKGIMEPFVDELFRRIMDVPSRGER